MRFNMLCALIVSVGLSTSVFAANTHEHRRLVNVSGQGAVSVVPDAFTVSVVFSYWCVDVLIGLCVFLLVSDRLIFASSNLPKTFQKTPPNTPYDDPK